LKNIYPYGAPAAGSLGAMSPGQGAGANLGDEDTKGGRVTLDYKPNDDILVRFAGNYVETKVGTGPYQSKSTIGVLNAQGELINVIDTPANETRLSIQGLADGGANAIDGSSFSPGAGIGLTGRPVPGGDFFGYKDPDGAGWLTSSDYAFADNGYTRTSGANVMLDWNLGGGTTFSAITDYKQFNKSLFIDVDSAPVNQLANYAGVNANSLTEELRLSGHTKAMRWVTGLYYLTIDNHSDNGLKAPVNSIINTAFGAPFDIGVVSRLKTDSLSLFGQGEWDLSDKLTLTAGARGIHEKKDFNTEIGFFLSQGNYTFNQGAPLPNVPVAGAPFLYSDSNAQNLWAGKVQLDYHLSNDVLLYGGLNRGVKAGSYNAPLLGAYLGSGGNASLPYKAEQLTSFETGFKSTFNDGRTRLNGSVFYYDYKDYQAFLFVGVGGVVINRPATNIGAELTLQTQITDGLDLSIGLSKYDATVKDVPLRYGSPLPPINVKPTYSPETQASAVLRYEWPAWGGKLHVLGEATYTGSFFYNLRNFSADQFPSVVMLNGGFGWTSLEKTWQVSLEGRNLSDAKAGVQGFDLASLCGCNEVSYQPPRWFGLRLKRSF